MLVGNKSDLNSQRKVSKERAKQLADAYGIPFIETSAKSNENIEKLFIDSTKAFIEKQLKSGNSGLIPKIRPSDSAVNLSTVKIDKSPKKRKCCH